MSSDRYAELRQVARSCGVDAVALVPGANFTRLFGKGFHVNERPLLVVVPVEGMPAAIVPNLELRSFDQIGFEGEVFDWRDQDGYDGAFTALARHLPMASLGVEGQVMRVFVHHALVGACPGIRIVDAEREISGLRIRKTPAEVAALRRAIRISEAALGEVLERVCPGQTEKEVEGMLVQALFAHGSEEHAFSPIVAAGANSAMPHAKARPDYPIRSGDALLLDFGARADGFAADITRTVFVDHATDGDADMYDTVMRANRRGHEVTRPGVTAHDIDDAVTGVLESSAYAGLIRTKTGHGLGRDVHEAPYIMRGNDTVMQPGMVFTNEPGLYRAGALGVRIEDDMLVTEAGVESLTEFPRDLRVVGTRC